MNTKEQKIIDILNRGTEKIVRVKELEKKLRSGKKLRIKHGIDPSKKDLHLGYFVVYEKLRLFQELGHQVIFLIGDFTGMFGDPTQKTKTRKLRDKKEVKETAKDYIKQLSKILNIKKLEIRYNSEWHDKMKGEDLLRLMSHFTVNGMLRRNMFRKRIKQGLEIQLHEPIYPVLQAYDSVMLKSDVEIGGNDQLFNMLRGRDLQRDYGQSPQDVITTKLLIGTDGKQKMSQSLGNYIGFGEKSEEQYGKIMSISDKLIKDYFEMATRVPITEIKKIKKQIKLNPKKMKSTLAKEVITIFHGKKAAFNSEKEFNRVFKEKKAPLKIPGVRIREKSLNVLDLLKKTKMALSKTEAKRLILQKGIKIDNKLQQDWKEIIKVKKGLVLQKGKRKFVKII